MGGPDAGRERNDAPAGATDVEGTMASGGSITGQGRSDLGQADTSYPSVGGE